MLTDGLTNGRVQVSAWLVAEDRDAPYDGSTKTDNPLQERTRVRVYLVSGDIRLSERVGLQLTTAIPDVTRSAVVQRPAGPFYFSETFRGIGDTSMLVWRRTSWRGWGTTINGGVSLPTGKTEQPRFRGTDDTDSLIPASRLQRGSGTVDPIFGVSINRLINRVFPGGVRVFASGAARVPVAENGFGLRTGASWEIGTGASREVKWHQFVVIGRLSWLHREQDVFEGVPVLVGGGDWLAIAPSVSFTVRDVTMQGEVKLPLHRSLANRQLDSPATFQLGMTWKVF